MSMKVTSRAFEPGGSIPKQHTGEGRDVSPQLSWRGVPDGARELALICDDPDAPTPEPWVHWVLYGLAPTVAGLDEGDEGDAGGGVEGENSWGTVGYRGPMPPPGHGTHHYRFRLYALDAELDAGPGLTKAELLRRMAGHVVGEGELVGTYRRD